MSRDLTERTAHAHLATRIQPLSNHRRLFERQENSHERTLRWLRERPWILVLIGGWDAWVIGFLASQFIRH